MGQSSAKFGDRDRNNRSRTSHGKPKGVESMDKIVITAEKLMEMRDYVPLGEKLRFV
nr:MAG TPA: hypothetical protein [Caudoviricetes sp.]